MKAYAEQPFDYLNADVLDSGASYRCPAFAELNNTECIEDEVCIGVKEMHHPATSDVATIEQMHRARELKSCKRHYTLWLKVLLHDGDEKKVRCAWKYGTQADTKFRAENDFNIVKDFLSAHPLGSSLSVWSLPTAERCVVGVADPMDFGSWERWQFLDLVGVPGAVLVFCLLYFAKNLKELNEAKQIPSEDFPPNGIGKGRFCILVLDNPPDLRTR
eukprot:4648425-Prymnesium_polylepis.1